MADKVKQELLLTPEEIEGILWGLAKEQARQEKAYEQSGRNPLAKPKQFSELDRYNALLQAQLAKAKQYYHPSIEAQKLQAELIRKDERERIEEKMHRATTAHALIERRWIFEDDWQALKGEGKAKNG